MTTVVVGGRRHRAAATVAIGAGATTRAAAATTAARPDGPLDRPPPRGPIDAGAPPPLREQVESANAFVIVGSPPFAAQRRLVSHEAYGWFLAAQPAASRATLLLLANVDGATPSAPVTWVTHAQAEAFCHAIDAELPTSAQWAIYAGERAGPVTIGPVSEWTGPAADGVALVREPRDRAAEPDDPLYLGSEATPGVKPASVAGASVGFRCVR